MATMAPFYESGIWRFTTPLLSTLFIAAAVHFMRRSQWAWDYMKCVAAAGVLINVPFFPTPEFYGNYTWPARLFVATEIASCAVILWSILRHSETRAWFTRNKA